MKKPDDKKMTAAKIVAGVAATLVVGANVSGCVYGPPPEDPTFGVPTEAYGSFYDYDPGDNNTVSEYEAPYVDEDVEETSSFETENNMNADVYGPPVDIER